MTNRVCNSTRSVAILAAIGGLFFALPAGAQTTSDVAAWQRAQGTDTPSSYRAYLTQFPTGAYAGLATVRAAPPLLADMLPVPPKADNAEVQTEIAAARSAWDNTSWQRIKAANTHMAYREYLIHLPVGEHAAEALSAYQASLPAGLSRPPQGCQTPDQPHSSRQSGTTRLKYPALALQLWTGGLVLGETAVDYTGKSLGATVLYATDMNLFGDGARTASAGLAYAPAIKNCAFTPSSSGFIFSWRVGDLPFESRQNAATPPRPLALNQRLSGQLTPDRAELFSFTPSKGVSVYEIEFKARFPHLLTQVDTGEASPNDPLVNNKFFATQSDAPIILRVSAPDKPNSRRQNMGPFQMTIRQVFNKADINTNAWLNPIDAEPSNDDGEDGDD